ncbi:hypothetical protein ACWDV4_28510 [Micromonospora sp. NPDC003197]
MLTRLLPVKTPGVLVLAAGTTTALVLSVLPAPAKAAAAAAGITARAGAGIITEARAGAGIAERVVMAQRAAPGAGCPPGQDDCNVWDDEPGKPGRPGTPGGGGGGGGSRTCQRDGVPLPCYDPLLGWFNNSDGCYYALARPQPPGGPAGKKLYMRSCAGGPASQEPVWLDAPPDGFGTPPDPAELARRALASITLRQPTVGIAPNKGPGLVGLPVWLWTDPGPQTWGPQRASASAPGLTVRIEARVEKIVWTMGNGSRPITCTNPGVVYNPVLHRDTTPTCGYAGYPRSSRSQPGGTYKITATTTWRVTWTGGGRQGTLPLQTRTSDPREIRVDELQVVTE